jgi:Ribonuclease G/E
MSRRRLYLDTAPGERRGVVTLDGRPERLLIARADDSPAQQLGARLVGRLRRVERTLASAFVDLGEGDEALLPLTGAAARLAEGAAVEVEVTGEARRGKGPVVRFLGPAEGPPRVLTPAPALAERLRAYAPDAALIEGADARAAADAAEAAALAVEHGLPGGGVIAIEATRALTAVDVDMGTQRGDPRRAGRQTNLAAIAHAARLLRLKALGGLIIIDLIGASHDGAALTAAVKAAFEPDEPGVSVGPVSRFGVLQLVTPRRFRPVAEILCDAEGAASPTTTALRLLRALEREGRADGGARLVGRCSPAAAQAAGPYMSELTDRLGPRFEIRAEPAFARDQFEAFAS